MAHGSGKRVPRTYLVTVRGRLAQDDAARLVEGILDAGERLRAASVAIRKASGRESHATVVLTEGRNREVRRLFDAAGHEVTALSRVQFGGLALGTLAPGRWREVSVEELAQAIPGPRRAWPGPQERSASAATSPTADPREIGRMVARAAGTCLASAESGHG